MRRSLSLCCASLCLSVLVSACASTSGSSADAGAGAPAGSQTTSSTSSNLTRAEIESANLPTAYDVVDRLRRHWFRRDARSGNDVSVIIDNRKLGGIESLRDIPAADLGEMRLIQSDEAKRRWPNLWTKDEFEKIGNVILLARR